MILQLILSFVFGIVNVLLLPFSGISFLFRTDAFTTVMQYLNVVFYILPIQNFVPIIAFVIATMGLRIIISLLKTIWSILPFV